MAQVKVGSDKLPVPDKIQFARQVVLDMTGNANFTTPAPTLASTTTAATALETAFNNAETARQVAKSKTAIMEAANLALNVLLMQLGNYVENTSGGDTAKIESSGYSVRNVPSTPIGDLPAPSGVSVVPSESSGTVDMKWITVRGARSYIVERALDAATLVWTPALSTTKAKGEVNTMTSGQKYWFRVAAVGAAGQGAWSAEISKYAP